MTLNFAVYLQVPTYIYDYRVIIEAVYEFSLLNWKNTRTTLNEKLLLNRNVESVQIWSKSARAAIAFVSNVGRIAGRAQVCREALRRLAQTKPQHAHTHSRSEQCAAETVGALRVGQRAARQFGQHERHSSFGCF